jgi:hypothetical protein
MVWVRVLRVTSGSSIASKVEWCRRSGYKQLKAVAAGKKNKSFALSLDHYY